MDANEARILLGFPPNSTPSPSEVKSAYKQKVWESHPDLFPSHEKPLAESKFKLISEAYTCLLPGRTVFAFYGRTLISSYSFVCICFATSFEILNNIQNIGGRGGEASTSDEYWRVVRTGVPRASGGRKNHAMIKVPFLFIILGTVALGGFHASRAYKRQKEEYPSHNPFLP